MNRARHHRAPRDPRILAAALVALCLIVYLPGLLSIPPVDRDESRFAQASRQMAESSSLESWTVPRVQDRPRLNKPPLIYWFQASSALALSRADTSRDAIWMYRIPSVILPIVTVLLTFSLGASMFGRRTGFLAGALLAVCPMMVWEANQARADHLLTAVTTATMLCLWHIRRRAQRDQPPGAAALLFWILLGIGILSKGPITPLIALASVLTLSILSPGGFAWIRRARPLPGILLSVAIVAPWVIAVASFIGFENYLRIVYDETIGRSTSAREGHWGPPGYHLVLFVVLFWPGSILAAIALFRAGRRCFAQRTDPPKSRRQRWRARTIDQDAAIFCLSWIAVPWLVFELIGTKLPHYTLPLFPPIAILAARAFTADAFWEPLKSRAFARAGFVIWIILSAALILAPNAFLIFDIPHVALAPGAPRILIPILSLAALLLLALAATRAMQWQFRRAAPPMIAAAAVFAVNTLGILLPNLRGVWITRDAFDVIDAADPSRALPVATTHFREDSLVFLSRARLERLRADDTDRWASEHDDGFLILTAVETPPPGVTTIATIDGFNYSTGEPVTITIHRITK